MTNTNIIEEVLYILAMTEHELAETMGTTPEQAQEFQSELRAVIHKHRKQREQA